MGTINIPDLIMGDANGDNNINAFDFSILGASYGSSSDTRADFNNDGVVNSFDLSIMGTNYLLSGETP